MSIPANYKIYSHDGCHSCRNCFVFTTERQEIEYFCTADGEPRPPCNLLPGEQWDGLIQIPMHPQESLFWDEYQKYFDSWKTWAETHQVAKFGHCSSFTDAKFNQ